MAGARLFAPILAGALRVKVMAAPALPHAVTSVRDFAKTLLGLEATPLVETIREAIVWYRGATGPVHR